MKLMPLRVTLVATVIRIAALMSLDTSSWTLPWPIISSLLGVVLSLNSSTVCCGTRLRGVGLEASGATE